MAPICWFNGPEGRGPGVLIHGVISRVTMVLTTDRLITSSGLPSRDYGARIRVLEGFSTKGCTKAGG